MLRKWADNGCYLAPFYRVQFWWRSAGACDELFSIPLSEWSCVKSLFGSVSLNWGCLFLFLVQNTSLEYRVLGGILCASLLGLMIVIYIQIFSHRGLTNFPIPNHVGSLFPCNIGTREKRRGLRIQKHSVVNNGVVTTWYLFTKGFT